MKVVLTIHPQVDITKVVFPGEPIVDPDTHTVTYVNAVSVQDNLDGFYGVDGQKVAPWACIEHVTTS